MKEEVESREDIVRFKPINNFQVSIGNEDHTLLNLLRYSINHQKKLKAICGYSIPHPSERNAILRIQFEDQNKQTQENMKSTIVDGLIGIEKIGEKLLECLEKEI